MADYGIKVSQDGYDVKTATPQQLIFSSQYPPIKVIQSGSAVVSLALNATLTRVRIPIATYSSGAIYTICFAPLTGGYKFRGTFGSWYTSDFIELGSYTMYDVDPINGEILLSVGRTSNSSTWPGAIDTTVDYYALAY